MDYSAVYDPDTDFDRWYTNLTARRIFPMLEAGCDVLELGSATCGLTRHLIGAGRKFVCVEQAASYVERGRARELPGVLIVHGTIEAFPIESTFDHILAVNVLHELPEVDVVLGRMVRMLRPAGLLHVTLPNPHSLHRMAALGAGLISDLCAPSARGRQLQTIKLQDAASFVAGLGAFGLREVHRDAVMVKPLPNEDMARVSDELIEAWDDLARVLPEHGALTRFVFERVDD